MMQWCVVYDDDSRLMQFEGGKENRYLDIDRSHLSKFIMLDGEKVALVVEFERPTQKLIYRKRTTCDLYGNVKGIVYLVGWHENINGTNIKVINYIYPDRIILAGAKDDLELLEIEV